MGAYMSQICGPNKRNMWKTVVYTSAVTFFLAVPEMLLADGKRSYVYWALGVTRLAALWAAIVLWISETSTRAALAAFLFSVALYAVSYMYTVVETRLDVQRYGRATPKLTPTQEKVLALVLIVPDTNWLFNVPGWFAPRIRLSHILVVGANVFIVAFAAYFYFIEDRFVNAYGCYPSDATWRDFDKGLCPAFTGVSDVEKNYLCKTTSDYARIGAANRCYDPKPPSPVYRDVFNHAVMLSLGMYWLTVPEKWYALTGL